MSHRNLNFAVRHAQLWSETSGQRTADSSPSASEAGPTHANAHFAAVAGLRAVAAYLIERLGPDLRAEYTGAPARLNRSVRHGNFATPYGQLQSGQRPRPERSSGLRSAGPPVDASSLSRPDRYAQRTAKSPPAQTRLPLVRSDRNRAHLLPIRRLARMPCAAFPCVNGRESDLPGDLFFADGGPSCSRAGGLIAGSGQAW